MNFGLSQDEFEFLNKELIVPLKSLGAQIWIFGSRARGDHKRYSDIDVMVSSNKELNKLLSERKEFFENSNFPYKLDLVFWNEFADSYKDNFHKEKIEV